MSDLNQKVQNLKQSGKKNPDIIDQLKKDGHSSQEIYDAMNAQDKTPDTDLKPPTPSQEMGSEGGFETPENEETATESSEESSFMSEEKFPAPQKITGRQQIEEIEEIAESIINEKLDQLSVNLGEFNLWKEKASNEMEAIKQEILRIRNHMDNLQGSMVGKVESYRQNISDLGVEVKTLSKVLEKVLEPLSNNVKELNKITEKLKK